MKCANCGAELKVGCIYCSVCGNDDEIVKGGNYRILSSGIADTGKHR